MKLMTISILLFISNLIISQNTDRIDDLKKRLSQQELSINEKCKIYNKIAHYYSDTIHDKTSAIEYYNKALFCAERTDDVELKADIINNLGVCYEITGNHDSSIYCFNKYLNMSIELKDSIGIGDAFNNLGLVYEYNGQYKKAIENYIKSAEIKDQLPDTIRQIVSLISIGSIYRKLNKYDKAIKYINEALQKNKIIGDDMKYARIYNELAMISKHQNKLDTAITFYEKTLAYSKNINWKKGIATALSNMANVYEIQEKYEISLKYHLQSLEIEEELNHYYGIILSKISLAELYNTLGNNTLAEKYINEVKTLATNDNNIGVLKDVNYILHKIFRDRNDYAKALLYYEIYSSYQDALYNQETTTKIAEIETKYQTEKKEQKIILLNARDLLKEEKIEKQIMFIKMLISIFVVFSIMFVVLAFMYVQRRKAHKALVKHNVDAIEYEKQNIILLKKEQERKYKNSNLNEEKKQLLLNDIIVFLEEEKCYLNPNFSIDNFAKKLSSNRQYISQLINEKFSKNFNSFINEYRVKEARRLLADSENNKYTIEGISKIVGFNSRTSFISSFKKYTGVTPSFFRKNYQNINENN